MVFVSEDQKTAHRETSSHLENDRAEQDETSVCDRDDVDEEKRGGSTLDPVPEWSWEEEKKALMKLDWNLIPLYVILFDICGRETNV